MAQKPTAKHTLVSDPQLAQLLQSYEGGLRAMQEHKYDKAKGLLQKVATGNNRELADRASVHLNACNQQLERESIQFKTPEEHYDYVVSLINVGDYVGAREHLDKLSKQVPKADYVAYGLAALDCLTGKMEDSMRNLSRAIGLNPALHFRRATIRISKTCPKIRVSPSFSIPIRVAKCLYPKKEWVRRSASSHAGAQQA